MNIFLHNAFSYLVNLLTFTTFHLAEKGPHGDKGSQGEKGIPGTCDAKVWRWSYRGTQRQFSEECLFGRRFEI